MKQKTKDIIRWVVLLPAICITWLVAMFASAWIGSFFYDLAVWLSFGSVFLTLDVFVVPSVAMFFVAKYIAPKYKNMAGVGAVALCALWYCYFVFTLAQTY